VKTFVIKFPVSQFNENKIQVLHDMAKLYSDYHSGRFRRRLEQNSQDPRLVVQNLLSLLTSRRGLGVTDPRDMLFVYIGLLGNIQLNESLFRLIEIDYEKKQNLVFFDVARFLTQFFQDYRILTFLEHRHPTTSSNTTSWIPDWTATSPPQYLAISSAL
jgi:hypothetical protein